MEKIVILDFGSQYTQLVARKIRSFNVSAEIIDYDTKYEDLTDLQDIKGIIFSGGPKSVNDADAYIPEDFWFDLNIPIFGICYGMQYLAKKFNGVVTDSIHSEYGKAHLEIKKVDSKLVGNLESDVVWMSHGCSITKLPDNFELTAISNGNEITAFENAEKQLYGTQFHIEVTHSECGMEILENFLFDICNIKKEWFLSNFIDSKIAEIKELVKDEKVIMGISGGVDSVVAAQLIHLAIGEQLTCVYVDHGLMRKGETTQVMDTLKDHLNMNIICHNAQELFLGELKGIDDPEEKRKIIGRLFIDCFNSHIDKTYSFLGQGTLYTDIIESGSKVAQTIKSHHNVGGLPEDMHLKLVEPLNALFKDEVREVGTMLGLDASIVQRQPFPGPGLAIRIIGEITDAKLDLLREADAILRQEIINYDLQKDVWQYFCVLTNTKTVGVKGDERDYGYTLALRCVESTDGMTADFAKIDISILGAISSKITNNVKEITRVVYDITSKPPATIEWE